MVHADAGGDGHRGLVRQHSRGEVQADRLAGPIHGVADLQVKHQQLVQTEGLHQRRGVGGPAAGDLIGDGLEARVRVHELGGDLAQALTVRAARAADPGVHPRGLVVVQDPGRGLPAVLDGALVMIGKGAGPILGLADRVLHEHPPHQRVDVSDAVEAVVHPLPGRLGAGLGGGALGQLEGPQREAVELQVVAARPRPPVPGLRVGHELLGVPERRLHRETGFRGEGEVQEPGHGARLPCHHPGMDITDIHGVGEALAEALRAQGLGSLREVARASIDELVAVPGIGPDSAKRIRKDAKRLITPRVTETRSPAPAQPEVPAEVPPEVPAEVPKVTAITVSPKPAQPSRKLAKAARKALARIEKLEKRADKLSARADKLRKKAAKARKAL